MKKITVVVDEELWWEARRKAFETGVSLTEVVTRLLRLYVAGKINVRPVENPYLDPGEFPELEQKKES